MRPLHIMQQFPNKWEPLWLCGQGFQPIWSRELMAQFWLSVIQGGTGVGWFFDSVETQTSRWRLISESGQVALAVEDISRAVVANSSAVRQFTTQVNTTSGLLAAAFEEEKQSSLESGMNDFLTKPIDQRSLRQVLEKHLGHLRS